METNLAVLIDFENIAAGTEKEGLGRFDVDCVLQRIKDKGRVLVARSYADWGRFARFKQSLLTSNVTMMELTSHGMQDKNRADIAMVVDALELAFTKDYIETYVIVSGDSDFTPMVLKLRELNKRVIGCGTRSSTSRLLIQACDEFIFYDSIATKKPKRRRQSGSSNVRPDRGAAYELMLDTLAGIQRESTDPPLASIVKTAMLRKVPDFSEIDLGFSSFARFLESARAAKHIVLSRDQKSGGYRVNSVDDGESTGDDLLEVEGEADWSDPYLPEGAESVLQELGTRGLDPLSAPVRKAILEAFEASVLDRKKRRRRVNIQFISEDIKKRLRRTHGDLPGNKLRGVLDALLKAELLIHKDGTPIRSASAPFMVHKDSEELNLALTNLYLRELREAGHALSDSRLLAALFLGDAERNRTIEEVLAWLDAPSLDEVDLDDLLSVEPTAEEVVIDAEIEELLEVTLEDAVPADPKPVVESAPALEEADSAPEASAEAALEQEEAPPKPKTRRRPRKKVEAVEAPATDGE